MHAAMRRVPVLFFEADDFVPDPSLAAMLSFLKRNTPAQAWIKCRGSDMEGKVVGTLKDIAKSSGPIPHVTQFCDILSDQRSSRRVRTEIGSTELSFLSGLAPISKSRFSIDRVDLLLGEVEALVGSGQDSFTVRLSRLWMALRELAIVPEEEIDEVIATRWIALCEQWTHAAAWLHLHGPLELGVLATLHTRAKLSQRGFIEELNFPYGGFASEFYSIGKLSQTREWQRRRFQAARKLATKQIEIATGDASGSHGIRASAAMQLAQRGRPWLVREALSDYKKMLSIRQSGDHSLSEVGEAMVELGYAKFRVGDSLGWRGRSSLEQINEGVSLLMADNPAQRAGFVKRALAKQVDATERMGLFDETSEIRNKLAAFVQANGLPAD